MAEEKKEIDTSAESVRIKPTEIADLEAFMKSLKKANTQLIKKKFNLATEDSILYEKLRSESNNRLIQCQNTTTLLRKDMMMRNTSMCFTPNVMFSTEDTKTIIYPKLRKSCARINQIVRKAHHIKESNEKLKSDILQLEKEVELKRKKIDRLQKMKVENMKRIKRQFMNLADHFRSTAMVEHQNFQNTMNKYLVKESKDKADSTSEKKTPSNASAAKEKSEARASQSNAD